MPIVIVTEKPSVARDIAAVLGLRDRNQGYIGGRDYKVTWAIGHLVALAEPQQLQAKWKHWRLEDLPMLPERWELDVLNPTLDQFNIVAKLLNDPDTTAIICATDAGREGELIFRYIFEKAGCNKPVSRLWISSLTAEAIRDGLNQLRPSQDFDGLADAARARSRADWLVGMNLSRAYSLVSGQNFSVGRVQTPTLAMLVERESAIQNFVSENYILIEAHFKSEGQVSYKAQYIKLAEKLSAKPKLSRLQAHRFQVDDPILAQIEAHLAGTSHSKLAQLEEKTSRLPPPQFYDLTELQRHANRLFGFSAQRTLDLLQSLYERDKLITYPRTDSRYISEDLHPKVCEMAKQLRTRYAAQLAEIPLASSTLGSRFVDDKQIRDHHAILPTGKNLEAKGLDSDHAKIFDLICRRVLTAFLGDCIGSQSEALIELQADQEAPGELIHFIARGRRTLERGWKILEFTRVTSADLSTDLPDDLRVGQVQIFEKHQRLQRKTLPPSRYTDASLLTAMETAGSGLKDKKLAAAMRDHGLGTPATRSQIIETLIKRQYVERDGKSFRVLPKGLQLVECIHAEIKSPQLTGNWEYRLNRIQAGHDSLASFSDDIAKFVAHMTEAATQAPKAASSRARPNSQNPLSSDLGDLNHASRLSVAVSQNISAAVQRQGASSAEQPANNLLMVLQQRFGHSQFRAHQERVCRDLVGGQDVLLVMPTGAGKSLCYQLPGLALGGRTLVISPLIALMDDQVSQLQKRGMRASALHSGKTRAESQDLCRMYAAGQIDFLFVAPERLGVPGFIQFLAKFPPTLIAIDEAHCISQWGHDFRFDYRRLGERLRPLESSVRVAMTATATQRVQADIIAQLELRSPALHVHGFRRTNIAIENLEIAKSDRLYQVQKILANSNSLPCIIYSPTRKDAEKIAEALQGHFRAAAYHAGMPVDRRQSVQQAFQNNSLDLIVATVAFGMGIDKSNVRTVIHMAVPSSIEGYYQEIGRAGRDGAPSQALLFYSFADLKTHEYFLKRNYPEPKILDSLLKTLPDGTLTTESLRSLARDPETEQQFDRLRMFGALQEREGTFHRSQDAGWRPQYIEQRNYRFQQLEEMHRSVQFRDRCRMLRLMAHFGDPDAEGLACGLCDVCKPREENPDQTRPLSAAEQRSLAASWEYLRTESRPVASGRLFKECAECCGLERSHFERLLDFLGRNKDLEIRETSFVKEGQTIAYRTVQPLRLEPATAWSDLKFPLSLASSKPKKGRSGATKAGKVHVSQQTTGDAALLDTLKQWRKIMARERKIPAFCILSDKSLEALARELPRTLEELRAIEGIGNAKLEQFGSSLLGLMPRQTRSSGDLHV